MPTYYQPGYYRWDSLAQASYLSIDNPGSSNDKFVTYDNEMACQSKISFARANGLGGVFIWELGGGQLPSGYPARDRLLQSVKRAAQNLGVAPPVPASTFPLNNTVGTTTSPLMSWAPSPAASWYRFQIGTDLTFATNKIAQDWIIWNSFQVHGLSTNTAYYWRVSSYNPTDTSSWSHTSAFQTIANSSLPTAWAYSVGTGRSARVIIPSAVRPTIGTQSIHTGDAIGVFYTSNGIPTCAGYNVWQEGNDLELTVWGDNPQTPWKDGLSDRDTLVFKIWSTDSRQEYSASPTYFSGGPTFGKDSTSVLASLYASPLVKQVIVLSKGINLVSSFARPVDSTFGAIFSRIRSSVLAVQDATDGLFKPDSNINTLGTWNTVQGYKVYMRRPDTLTITGDKIPPAITPVPLSTGWNLVPYLRDNPMSVDSAFGSILNTITVAKNQAGGVYWPAVGINTMDLLRPGQAYYAYVRIPSTLLYPGNATPVSQSRLQKKQVFAEASVSVVYDVGHSGSGTSGSNAILLVESPELNDGDEVHVRTASETVGKGRATGGRALITVIGDNRNTPDVVEGASEGDPLTLSILRGPAQQEKPLVVTSLMNALSDEPLSPSLAYTSNAVWIARTTNIPDDFQLEQNYPNPFNPTTTIRYSLPADAKVTLEVFDILGRKVKTLVDEEQKVGRYDVVFESRGLASGAYFYRLIASTGPSLSPLSPAGQARATTSITRQMLVLK